MSDKMHDVYDKIYGQDNPDDGPHGWIQWKGTSVCMDTHCVCGYHGHIDSDFFYRYECPKCHRKYAVGQVVKLIEMSSELIEEDEKSTPWGSHEFIMDRPDDEDGVPYDAKSILT